MIQTIQPSSLSGSVTAPASKSSMQRALAAALLHRGETLIHNPGNSNDDLAAIEVIRVLGATVKESGEDLSITSKGVMPVSGELSTGESGLGLRMFAPIAAMGDREIILNGSGSLLKRPMDFFDEIFPLLCIGIHSNEGKLPLRIKGPLQPANITIDGSLSSQFLTGLMMAFAASLQSGSPVTITVKDLTSKPYIDLTLQVMKHFGWQVENRDYKEFHFVPAVSQATGKIEYTVEGDWSGAAFLLIAGALAGPVRVKGLDRHSTQADKVIMQALEKAGAKIMVEDKAINIGPAPLKAFSFDATDCPDLFPPLVALASKCRGTTSIKGVHRLTHKESNRSLALSQEFGKMGVQIRVENDAMLIDGTAQLNGATVYSHHDHRIAMAMAIAGLAAKGETIIHEAEAVSKSYPAFYDHLGILGARLQAG